MLDRKEQNCSHAGPSLGVLAIMYTLLGATSIISGLLLKHGSAILNPYSSADQAREFFAANPVALRVSAFFLFVSSVTLGMYAAIVVSRLRLLCVRAPGSYVALFGGFTASTALGGSAFCVWELSVPEVAASLVATRVLHFMTILLGGVGFAVAFGLFAAGISITTYFSRLLPRRLACVGILIGATGGLSSLSLLTLWAAPLIPMVRFAGFVWLIAVGTILPKTPIATPTAPTGSLGEECTIV